MKELRVKQVRKGGKLSEQEAQIPMSSIPAAETTFPRSTSMASKMTGLLKTKQNKTKQNKTKQMSGSESQISLHSVLPPM